MQVSHTKCKKPQRIYKKATKFNKVSEFKINNNQLCFYTPTMNSLKGN